jgi:hypothetical protein
MDTSEHAQRLQSYAKELGERATALRARAQTIVERIAQPHTPSLSACVTEAGVALEEAERVDRRGDIVRRALALLGERAEEVAA